MKKIIYLMSIILFFASGTSCSMLSNRKFISEMEQSDGMWVAHDDFQVVSGDTGQAHRTNREIISRTPASFAGEAHQLEYQLNRELHELENQQTEELFDHYQQYRDKLANTSERIFFLRLPNRLERERYVYSKGIYANPYFTQPEQVLAAANRDIVLGMSKPDVIKSWGRPDRVDYSGDPSFENERWLYRINGNTKLVYFEQGRVDGWEDGM